MDPDRSQPSPTYFGRARLFLPLAPLAVAALGLAAAYGCTGETSFPLPTWDAGAPTAQHAPECSAWAAVICGWEARCLPKVSSQWIDSDQCRARETLYCELVASDPAVSFDAAAVASCAYPDDCSASTPGLCLGPGKLPARSRCAWDEACAAGFCEVGQGSACGSCVSFQGCSLACDGDAGLVCLGTADGGSMCIVPPAVGEPCRPPDYVCSRAAVCQLGSAYGSDGICVPAASVGEPCSDQGNGPVCADALQSLFCDPTQHCRAYSSAGYGQTCGPAGDGGADYYECTGWASCEYAVPPVCAPPAADGTLCDDQQGLSCLPPARCIGETCVFPNAAQCH